MNRIAGQGVKVVFKNGAFTAAVNRCATHRLLPAA